LPETTHYTQAGRMNATNMSRLDDREVALPKPAAVRLSAAQRAANTLNILHFKEFTRHLHPDSVLVLGPAGLTGLPFVLRRWPSAAVTDWATSPDQPIPDWAAGSAGRIPASRRYDLVACPDGCHFLPGLVERLTALARHLNPCGYLYVHLPLPADHPSGDALLRGADADALLQAAARSGLDLVRWRRTLRRNRGELAVRVLDQFGARRPVQALARIALWPASRVLVHLDPMGDADEGAGLAILLQKSV
jgi:hypothetical protein